MIMSILVLNLSEMVKVYYWFISKGGNLDAKQF